MNIRLMAATVTACAAGLSLAACSAGITTAKPAASRSPTPSRSAPPSSSVAASRSPSPSPSPIPADTIRLPAPIGSFPVPRGVKLVHSGSCPKEIEVYVGPVTPSRADAFYTTALPRAGYTIDGNMTGEEGGGTSIIEFHGHGHTGMIGAFADLGKAITGTASPNNPVIPIFNQMTKNVAVIALFPPGTPDTYQCP